MSLATLVERVKFEGSVYVILLEQSFVAFTTPLRQSTENAPDILVSLAVVNTTLVKTKPSLDVFTGRCNTAADENSKYCQYPFHHCACIDTKIFTKLDTLKSIYNKLK